MTYKNNTYQTLYVVMTIYNDYKNIHSVYDNEASALVVVEDGNNDEYDYREYYMIKCPLFD